MAKILDFYMEFVGTASNPFKPELEQVLQRAEMAKMFQVDKYFAAVQQLPQADRDRNVFVMKGVAGASIDEFRTMVMKQILDAVDGHLDRIGNFCALGASNSASAVLSVANALADLSAPRLAFLGVVDVTLVPFGRNPSINGVGTLQPNNAPDVSMVPGGTPWKTRLRRSVNAAFLPPPLHRPSGRVNAKTAKQIYQTNGNWIKVVSESPATGNEDWWWTSDMGNNEVHGKIDGWRNFPVTAVARTDDEKHVEVIDIQIPLLRVEASTALADFT